MNMFKKQCFGSIFTEFRIQPFRVEFGSGFRTIKIGNLTNLKKFNFYILQNMKFLFLFSFILWIILALLNPDPRWDDS
jgi:hypothetical protein